MTAKSKRLATGKSNTRENAAQILCRWLESGDFPNHLLDSFIVENRAFLMELVYGVVRWKRVLEWVLASRVRSQPELVLQCHLLVGLYQILFMTTVEDYAVVNEAVSAVKKIFTQKDANFVNALLRGVLREKESILRRLKEQSSAVQSSHPDLLVKRWEKSYGKDEALRLCEWNNRRADIVVSVNLLKTDASNYLRELQAAKVDCELCLPDYPGFIRLGHGKRVQTLPGYSQGAFAVMDPSVSESVALLDPRPGERVLDACAAPGGKTFLLAGKMQLSGSLVAMDIHADRLLRLRENLRRLGLDHFVEVRRCDMLKASLPDVEIFDRILLDVPCTNTGVIRRKPDVRWRFSEARLTRLVAVQKTMLDRASRYLKPNGVLAYSTCSLEPEENEGLVVSWLKNHTCFDKISEKKLFPPQSGTDGAYVALLQRQR